MNQSQRELRQAAAAAFMESLEQLGKSLQPADLSSDSSSDSSSDLSGNLSGDLPGHLPSHLPSHLPNAPVPPCPDRPVPARSVQPNSVDLADLEAAAADIEQFIQARSQSKA